MRSLVFIALLSAQAQALEGCEFVEEMAGHTMTARQAGASVRELYAVADSQKDKKITNLLKALIVEAYKETDFSQPGLEQIAISDFRNRMFLLCKSTEKK